MIAPVVPNRSVKTGLSDGVTIEVLADAIRRGSGRPVKVTKQLDQVIPELLKMIRPGDAVRR